MLRGKGPALDDHAGSAGPAGAARLAGGVILRDSIESDVDDRLRHPIDPGEEDGTLVLAAGTGRPGSQVHRLLFDTGGCGHVGVINICRYALRLTGVAKLHAVIGRFHLTGPLFEPIIDDTVRAPPAA